MAYTALPLETKTTERYGELHTTVRRRYKSLSKPYKEPVPYTRTDLVRRNIPNPWGFTYAQGTMGYGSVPSSPYEDQVYAKAWNKVRAQVHEFGRAMSGDTQQGADISVQIGEMKQSARMLSDRLGQVLKFTLALRRCDFKGAAKALGFSTVSERHKKQKTLLRLIKRDGALAGPYQARGVEEVRLLRSARGFSNNFLEFHFGWSPLFGDIYGALEAYASARAQLAGLGWRIDERASRKFGDGKVPSVARYMSGHSHWWSKTTCRIILNIRIEDPNAFQRRQWGLANPAIVAWELFPFSFVADWVANVNDVLSSFTDFAGVSMNNVCVTTTRRFVDRTYWCAGLPNYNSPSLVTAPVWEHELFSMDRSLSLHGPNLTFREFKWPSVTRGLTASSLLGQQLLKGVK